MHITLNGETQELQQAMLLSDFLASREDLPSNYAVAVNGGFVPRAAYSATSLGAGDDVELLIPMQGG